MADSTSIKLRTFADIVSVISNRANIAGTIQDRDLNFIKGAVNEWNVTISTERNWRWRTFDRDYVFDRAVTTGTVAVTEDSRTITFSDLTVDSTYLGRSIKIDGDQEIYRIIGINTSTDQVYLSTSYVGSTNATATFKLFQYEFPLPPDCDTIIQVYCDSTFGYYNNKNQGLDEVNNLQFNRLLANSSDLNQFPFCYTRDGKINAESLPPLDVMVLDYDFLGGEEYDQVEKFRVYPIQPDKKRVLHMNYTVQVPDLAEDADQPLMPVDNRWILVHFALGEWWRKNGALALSDREFAQAKMMLKEMRSEHHKTDIRPKFVMNKSRYKRRHYYDDRKDLFLISREN